MNIKLKKVIDPKIKHTKIILFTNNLNWVCKIPDKPAGSKIVLIRKSGPLPGMS